MFSSLVDLNFVNAVPLVEFSLTIVDTLLLQWIMSSYMSLLFPKCLICDRGRFVYSLALPS